MRRQDPEKDKARLKLLNRRIASLQAQSNTAAREDRAAQKQQWKGCNERQNKLRDAFASGAEVPEWPIESRASLPITNELECEYE
jgi:hypothetical protein